MNPGIPEPSTKCTPGHEDHPEAAEQYRQVPSAARIEAAVASSIDESSAARIGGAGASPRAGGDMSHTPQQEPPSAVKKGGKGGDPMTQLLMMQLTMQRT